MSISAESVTGSTTGNQSVGGGSIPASALSFHLGMDSDAKELVLRHHYSKRWPSNIQIVGTFHEAGGLFGTSGISAAGCVFSIPATRWSEEVVELSRLVRATKQVPLSLLIKLTTAAIRRKGFDLAVSFADRTQGHEGIVYRACSWNYGGCRDKTCDGLIVGGEFIPGRVCNHIWGTRSQKLLKERHGIDSEQHFDEGKHLYWKALTKSGIAKAARLGLESL